MISGANVLQAPVCCLERCSGKPWALHGAGWKSAVQGRPPSACDSGRILPALGGWHVLPTCRQGPLYPCWAPAGADGHEASRNGTDDTVSNERGIKKEIKSLQSSEMTTWATSVFLFRDDIQWQCITTWNFVLSGGRFLRRGKSFYPAAEMVRKFSFEVEGISTVSWNEWEFFSCQDGENFLCSQDIGGNFTSSWREEISTIPKIWVVTFVLSEKGKFPP